MVYLETSSQRRILRTEEYTLGCEVAFVGIHSHLLPHGFKCFTSCIQDDAEYPPIEHLESRCSVGFFFIMLTATCEPQKPSGSRLRSMLTNWLCSPTLRKVHTESSQRSWHIHLASVQVLSMDTAPIEHAYSNQR